MFKKIYVFIYERKLFKVFNIFESAFGELADEYAKVLYIELYKVTIFGKRYCIHDFKSFKESKYMNETSCQHECLYECAKCKLDFFSKLHQEKKLQTAIEYINRNNFR